MIIEKKQIADLIPAPYNPRQSTAKQEKHLKESLEKFGMVEPIIFNKQTGYIVGGHFRVRELKKLGIKEIECVIVDLNEADEKELNIRLNANTGSWDWDTLANDWEVVDLEAWGLDIPQFDTVEELEASEDDYDVPEGGIETDIVIGDLFEIGEHRLLCGDSTDSDAVARLMNGEKADMVFTDPPYGVDVKNTQGSILGDGDLNVFINSLPIIKLFADENAHFYVWCASGDMFPPSLAAFVDILPFQNILPIRVTHENKRGKKGAFKLNFETCLFGNNNERSFNSSGRFKVSETTLNDNRYKGDGKLKVYPALWDEERSTEHNMNIVHPTQKNVGMVLFYVEISSKASDIVLDLFLGSGTTMVAAHQLKRKCYGMELEPKYCQVIIDRMAKLDPSLKITRNGKEYKTAQ
jgi:DNA modification methylase